MQAHLAAPSFTALPFVTMIRANELKAGQHIKFAGVDVPVASVAVTENPAGVAVTVEGQPDVVLYYSLDEMVDD